MGQDYIAILQRRMQETFDQIPGYRGYRQKEDRRDEDRRVRDHVAAQYRAEGRRVERVAAELAAQRRIADVQTVDDLAKAIQHLVDRIQTATYGYGGLFSDRDVDLMALDQLRLFDQGLIDGVAQLEAPVAALEAALASGGDLKGPSREGAAVVRSVLDRLDLRGQVVDSGRPAAAEQVLAVLAPPKAPEPARAVKLGDAISVLGDNFVTEAAIEVTGGPAEFRLLRLRKDPEEWLLVPGRDLDGFARLRPAGKKDKVETTGDAPGYRVIASGSGEGNATGDSGSSTPRPVRYELLAGNVDQNARAVRLNWGTDALTMVGTQVHPDDVEVYGRPEVGR